MSSCSSFHLLFQLGKTNKSTDFWSGEFLNCQGENKYYKLNEKAVLSKEFFLKRRKKSQEKTAYLNPDTGSDLKISRD